MNKKVVLITTIGVIVMMSMTSVAIAAAPDLKLPYPGGESWLITQAYNGITHQGLDYYAIDFTLNGCDAYDKPVLAVASGTIVEVDSGHIHGELNSYGNKVIIQHEDGYTSLYGHLNQILVMEDQEVVQGEKIGTVGNTGYCLGGACEEYPGTHLHFRMLDESEEAFKPEPMSGYINFETGQWCLSDNYDTESPTSPKLDLVFLIDTTGSMGDDIAQVKASSTEIVEALDSTELDYRVAVADYRDYPESPYGGSMDYVYKLDLPFSNDKDEITNSINGLNLGWGADTPESVYSALVHSMEDSDKDPANSANSGWRNGVTKVIIIMGDAPPHIPEPWTGGHTLQDVISVSESIDPVIVYSIIIGSSEFAYDAFAEISEGTNGKVYSSPTANDIVATIIEVIGDIGETPETRGVFLNITPLFSEAIPGNSVEYSVNATNTGSIVDSYSILLELENFGFQRGYPVAIQSSWVTFNSAEVTLDPSMSETRLLTITVPENWAGMEDVVYGFSVTATSTADETISNTSKAELEVKADKRSMIEYSKLEIQWLAEMVDSSTIDHGIKNSFLKKLTNAESKLDQAIVDLDNGKPKPANNLLWASQNLINAFVNQVDAQYDKKIMQPDAEALKEKAVQITEDLEEARNN